MYSIKKMDIGIMHILVLLTTLKLIIQSTFLDKLCFLGEYMTFTTHSLMVKNQLHIIQVGIYLSIFFLFYLLTPT